MLAACAMESSQVVEVVPPDPAPATEEISSAPTPDLEPLVVPPYYAARADGGRMVPAIDVREFPQGLLRSEVDYTTAEAPGTIVIDTNGPFLYLVEGEGKATRYGIAVGREGFGWTGEGVIARTSSWPRWTPPPEMIEREPYLEEWRGGMPGGRNNPLGARALYIHFGGHDSGYRIHGTNQPGSIGRAASSGCFRMLNQDVMDLHDRIALGARVVVL
jgi:lipoprotein-anchoring transpeptidase ErfK/SrfK